MYCVNNPLRYIDPDGQIVIAIAGYEAVLLAATGAAIVVAIAKPIIDNIVNAVAGKKAKPSNTNMSQHSTPANPDPNDPNKGAKEYKRYSEKEIKEKYKLNEKQWHETKGEIIKQLTDKKSLYKGEMKRVGRNPDIHLTKDGQMKIVSTGKGNNYSFETNWYVQEFIEQ